MQAPEAALIATRGALKSGYLWKMGANVPRWKRRFFVLRPVTMLFYYLSEYDTEPRGCIDLDLFDAVREVREDSPGGGGGDSSSSASQPAGGSGTYNKRLRNSAATRATTFELYRSGCPDGGGFLLEARGDEDWEEWVGSIANASHTKMRSEMDVLKGANKLLMEEISGLEHQVATFRGYADQRHVTVLALRDERHRNRAIAAELAALADTASALSHLISEGLMGDQQRRRDQEQHHHQHHHQQRQEGGVDSVMGREEEADPTQQQQRRQQHGATTPAPGPSSRSESVDEGFDLGRQSPLGGAQPAPAAAPAAAAAVEAAAVSAAAPAPALAAPALVSNDRQRELSQQQAAAKEERLSIEAVKRALADARAELDRRGRALREESGRRQTAETTILRAQELAQAARKRAHAAEAAEERARGRAIVLERNVEYLQIQQRTLRAELRQSREKNQLVRAQKAVLKKEVQELWSGHVPLASRTGRSPCASASAGLVCRPAGAAVAVAAAAVKLRQPQQQLQRPRNGEVGGGRGRTADDQSAPRCGARASPKAGVSPLAAAATTGCRGAEAGREKDPSLSWPSSSRRCNTRPSAGASCAAAFAALSRAEGRAEERDEAEEEREEWRGDGTLNIRNRQRGGSMRSCLSGESLAAASDGGETDFADRTNSEASDVEYDVTGLSSHPTHDACGSVYESGVCRIIRKRVGPPRVPPLPPSRHRHVLAAVKRLQSSGDDTVPPPQLQKQKQQQQRSDGGVGSGDVRAGVGGGSGSSAAAVAGVLGMVDKAAQEVGKKFALWPGTTGTGAMPSVSSMGSLAAGAMVGASSSGSHNATRDARDGGCGLNTPVDSPRFVSTAGFSDSPVLWDPSSEHGSTTSTDPGPAMTIRSRSGGEKGGEKYGSSGLVAEQQQHFAPAGGGGFAADAKSSEMAVAAGGVAAVALAGPAAASALSTAVAAAGGARFPRVGSVSSRTALIQLADLELAEPCGRRSGDGGGGGGGDSLRTLSATASAPPSSPPSPPAAPPSAPHGSTSTTTNTISSNGQLLSLVLPPRPDDEYELVFSSRVIGIQFEELPDATGVFVAGLDGYAGPAAAPTWDPGDRLRPDHGDTLESYNGIPARAKPADVIAGELARCGRPLRLGFRSTNAEVFPAGRALEEEDEH